MKTVLSTRLLSPSQKELLLSSGIGLVEYNALRFEFLDMVVPTEYQNFIFTSKNSVKAFLKHYGSKVPSKKSAFCVGEKTKAILCENGIKVVKTSENALDLANFIINNHSNEHFLFITGNLRRPELPEILSKNNVRYKEIQGYRTHLVAAKYDRVFDGILFFSPSGIKSFLIENALANSWLFCIGNTTATEARKHTDQIIVANRPTVENVLVQAIKHFKKND